MACTLAAACHVTDYSTLCAIAGDSQVRPGVVRDWFGNQLIRPRLGRDLRHDLLQERPELRPLLEASYPHCTPACSPRSGRESEPPHTPSSRLGQGLCTAVGVQEGLPQ
eukprot:2128830-Amphidinium_carterae.1